MPTRKHQGLHPHRFKANPEERRFAEAWEQIVQHRNLHHLLDPVPSSGSPPTPEDRDFVVAATVIQWLGSPVGCGFLSDLGYRREETKTPPKARKPREA